MTTTMAADDAVMAKIDITPIRVLDAARIAGLDDVGFVTS